MRTPTRSPTLCASSSRHCASALANLRSSPPSPALATASAPNRTPGLIEETVHRAPGRRMLHLPSRTVRLRLTLLYSGLFLVSGVALLAATYLIFRSNTGVDLIVAPQNRGGLHGISQNPEVIRQVREMYETSVARNRHGRHE